MGDEVARLAHIFIVAVQSVCLLYFTVSPPEQQWAAAAQRSGTSSTSVRLVKGTDCGTAVNTNADDWRPCAAFSLQILARIDLRRTFSADSQSEDAESQFYPPPIPSPLRRASVIQTARRVEVGGGQSVRLGGD